MPTSRILQALLLLLLGVATVFGRTSGNVRGSRISSSNGIHHRVLKIQKDDSSDVSTMTDSSNQKETPSSVKKTTSADAFEDASDDAPLKKTKTKKQKDTSDDAPLKKKKTKKQKDSESIHEGKMNKFKASEDSVAKTSEKGSSSSKVTESEELSFNLSSKAKKSPSAPKSEDKISKKSPSTPKSKSKIKKSKISPLTSKSKAMKNEVTDSVSSSKPKVSKQGMNKGDRGTGDTSKDAASEDEALLETLRSESPTSPSVDEPLPPVSKPEQPPTAPTSSQIPEPTTSPTASFLEETGTPVETTNAPTDAELGTIVDIAASNPDLSTLVELLTQAGLLETLSGDDGPFTVFAPTNDAFDALDPEALEAVASDPDLLEAILLYHVVEGSVLSTNLLDEAELTTINGSPVTTFTNPPRVNDADIVDADVLASNGVIHVIDKVLIPLAEETDAPTNAPSVGATDAPVVEETDAPVIEETDAPVVKETDAPVVDETDAPVVEETDAPVVEETDAPVVDETDAPVVEETDAPVVEETGAPVVEETDAPAVEETDVPVVEETNAPVVEETDVPAVEETDVPLVEETDVPVVEETDVPVVEETDAPVVEQTDAPEMEETDAPVVEKTDAPVVEETDAPGIEETDAPVLEETDVPAVEETNAPTEDDLGSIVDIAASDPDLSILVGLLTQTGLDEVLSGDGPFTVFAPSNEAFAALDPAILEAISSDPDLLTDVLLYHVVEGTVLSSDLSDGAMVPTVNGANVTTFLNPPRVNNANITAADVLASNGVIHIMDAVSWCCLLFTQYNHNTFSHTNAFFSTGFDSTIRRGNSNPHSCPHT